MAEGEYAWESEAEKALYKRIVRACLVDENPDSLRRSDPSITPEAVEEAMCSSPYVEALLGSGAPRARHHRYRQSRHVSDLYFWALPTSPSMQAVRGNPAFRPWQTGVFICWGLTPFVVLDVGLPLALVYPLLFVVVPALALARPAGTRPTVWSGYSMVLGPLTFLLWCVESLLGALWLREVWREDPRSQVERAVRDLIVRSGNPSLVASQGFRSLHDDSTVVRREVHGQLTRRLEALTDGVIAVSGPRGVGKSALMRTSVKDDRTFAVFAQAPAVYVPHEFLISLFVLVCQEYIAWNDRRVPELVRLSYLHRVRRRVLGWLREALPHLPYALLAAALAGLGLFASTKAALTAEHGVWGVHQVTAAYGEVSDLVRDVVRGERPLVAVALVGSAVLLWTMHYSRSFRKLVKVTKTGALGLITSALFLGPFFSLFFDPGIRRHFNGLPVGEAPTAIVLLLFLVLFWCLLIVGATSRRERWFIAAAVLYPFGLLAVVLAYEPLRPLVTDEETPLRVGAFLLGLMVVKLMNRRRRPGIASDLVMDCRDYLYWLQTVQNVGSTLSTGVPQFLALGTSHTGGLTSVPPNAPLLVREFVQLLKRIGSAEHKKSHRVVIVIDEIDRLGTEREALDFLADVKAIFGIERVLYLVSVAEDVGAALLRRGLPHRSVTDSSLDDVLHVPPCSLGESEKILRARVLLIDREYAMLAHGLSAGMPRDLIRYGRRLADLRDREIKLPGVTRTLVTEELLETLIGFRGVLAKQERTPGTEGALGALLGLTTRLRPGDDEPRTNTELCRALTDFAGYEADGLPDEPLVLVEEAGAHVCFSLTVLEIFGGDDFSGRLTATGRPDGDLELLARARQELSLSPHGARGVLDALRRTWRLDRLPARG